MDVAALALNIDSSSVVKATADLDRFSAASAKASSASGGYAGSIAKLVATVQSMDAKLTAIVGSLDRIARASRTAAAANDNTAASVARVGTAMAAADAHVVAYTQHLAGLVTSQRAASAAIQQADAHVVAYRNHLASIAPAAASASQGVLQLRQSMIVAGDSAGAMQANTGNIAAQFQDIGVTAAMGMNPLIIGLQQGTQLSAVFAQSGGRMRDILVAAFRQIASAQALMTIGIVAAVAAIVQLVMHFATASSEADKLAEKFASVEWATDAMGKAQSILGGYMDTTTGKITAQSAALRDLALAQAMVAKVEAQIKQQQAQSAMQEMTRRQWGITGGPVGVGVKSFYAPESGIVEGFMQGGMSAKTALTQLERLKDMGQLSKEAFLDAAQAIANFNVETENIKKFDELTRGIGGESGLLQQFLNPKTTTRKSDAEKQAERLADILSTAHAEVDAETRRAQAVTMSAHAAAEMEQRAKLLNQAQQAGIPITAALAAEIDRLAKSYSDAKVAADVAEVMDGAVEAMFRQRQALNDEIALMGLYGEALYRARFEQDALNAARAAMPKGEALSPEAEAALKAGAASNASKAAEADRAKFMFDFADASAQATAALDRERAALGLTGEAIIAHDYVTRQLLDAKRQHIELSPAEVAAIEAAGEAYAAQRYQIDRQTRAIADAREVTKGFFSDWINGVREGGNIFKTFADSVVNSLNRIIDKLLDKTLDGFLDSMFSGGSGGLLGSIFGGGNIGGNTAGLESNFDKAFGGGGFLSQDHPLVKGFAHGGMFDQAQRFAKGGTFTNGIVSTPTLFRFAKGTALGEMGEAGPEAIMPLTRGPNGALGVRAHGGRSAGPPKVDVAIQQDFYLTGTVSQRDVEAMSREAAKQGAESAVTTVRRNFDMYLREWDTDGAVAA